MARKQPRMPSDDQLGLALTGAGFQGPGEPHGLLSSEEYSDPADAPRIATIYNGLYGRAQFVPFRKGDPEGSRWLDNEPLFCEWSRQAVDWLSTSPEARWQGHRFFLTAGVTWSLHANHVAAKCRYQDPCVFDASSSRLTPVIGSLCSGIRGCCELRRVQFLPQEGHQAQPGHRDQRYAHDACSHS